MKTFKSITMMDLVRNVPVHATLKKLTVPLMARTDYRPEEYGHVLLIDHWGFLAIRFAYHVRMAVPI